MDHSKFVAGYLDGVEDVVRKISKADIEAVIGVLYEAWKNDKAVYICGNGGSASTGTHFAADLNKYVSSDAPHRFRAFALVDNIPLMSALTNDDGWSDVYSYQLEAFMREGDVLVGISVHGGSGSDKAGPWSQNLLKAVKVAKEKKGKVVGLVGFDGGMLRKLADASIVVPADSTPQVEGFHLVLTHLISARLKDAIGNRSERY
ncbi:MAG: SIS domain-containing protein [Nitrososphaerota archaeon]|jgi:D-sedoheptulose 7-phosphate isomerase|nr:SIS domain-containing protein [Nitrososphaerota archaeon]MDG6961871.1 SIS domain-containing protein [Nitrososphaerota archaeon]MDG6968639.1 SIS domain-containing protein [Nitrososphaerota archaeon]MDG6969487.1 SIS domain-containing protein [Nitrososphaerota archaeon]MDG6974306.1 SIS domain-containing protein [Nitrososphaerota archaeon]